MSKINVNYILIDIIEQFERERAKALDFADAWCKVERVYKKDGGTFKNISKNFVGCKIYVDNYETFQDRKIASVNVCDYENNLGCITDYIWLYQSSAGKPFDNHDLTVVGIVGNSPIAYYIYTVEEIDKIIDYRINELIERIEKIDKVLNSKDYLKNTIEVMAFNWETLLEPLDMFSIIRNALKKSLL